MIFAYCGNLKRNRIILPYSIIEVCIMCHRGLNGVNNENYPLCTLLLLILMTIGYDLYDVCLVSLRMGKYCDALHALYIQECDI